jgi:ubiquinone/menaquinone biosynthesis C-methylase UbiE
MSYLKSTVKIGANSLLGVFGCEIRRRLDAGEQKADGFPMYVDEAAKVGMDVNDWEEQILGWDKALPILDETLFHYMRADSIVCNLGAGTGRWARHMISRLPKGELHLVDHSPWIVKFLTEYFRDNSQVFIHLNDGYGLPWRNPSLDLIFSGGTFIALKLGHVYLYAQEFSKVLRNGGYCVIEYIDVTTPDGWTWLETQSNRTFADCYTYYTSEIIEKVFTSAGFEIVNRYHLHSRAFLVCRKLN